MKKQMLTFSALFFASLSIAAVTTTFHKETPVRQYGKEEGMLLDLGKISMGTLNDVEEKKQYLSTVQLEKQRIQNYMLKAVYEDAYILYKHGDYQRAQEMAQTILSIDPNFKQAQTLAKQSQFMGTYGTISETQVIESKFQETLSLYDSGRLVEANDKLNEILTLQPGNSKAQAWKRKIDSDIAKEYARRGEVAYEKGNYQSALDSWYNALLMRKDDPKLVAKISDTENKLRKQQVEESMRQALNYYNNGQYVESYAVFERITKIQPGDPRVQKYMSQLKNEIAGGYYTAGANSYNAGKFDQAVSYWNNAKKWGADSTTIDGLVKRARSAKENFARVQQQEALRLQEQAKLAAEEAKKKAEEMTASQTPKVDEGMDIDDIDLVGPIPSSVSTSTTTTTTTTTTKVGTTYGSGSSKLDPNEVLPSISSTSRVSAEARDASRAKYIEGLDAFNQDDYERARQAWVVAKQLDPGNSDADLGLKKIEELLK